jgi:ubiquinone/menaquinone biosynthesis C-methylase UbiE
MELLENEVELVEKLCGRIKAGIGKNELKTPLKLLDIGCGTGRLALYLQEELKCDVTGVDLGWERIEKARAQSSSVTFEVQSADDLTFASNTFDVVVSLKALHEADNPTKVLEEAHRVMKEGGLLLFIDWIGDDPETEKHVHAKRYFTPEQLEEALSEAGFTRIAIERNPERGLMLAGGSKRM